MNTTPMNNPDTRNFYAGGEVFPGGAVRGNLGAMRRARRRGVGSLGAINASSSSAPATPTASGTTVAQDISSIVASGSAAVKGVLQAEAAQNAINAQKNFTSALTPGVITMGLAVLAYWLISKK